MTSSVEVFEELAAHARARPGITRNRKGSLVLEGRGVVAMTSRGSIVVRLDPGRVLELVAAGEGRHYKDQVNAWLELDADLPGARCRELLEESLRS